MTVNLPLALARLGAIISLPVLMKEMRSRMRGLRAPLLLFVATGLSITVGLLIIAPQWDNMASDSSSMNSTLSEIGRTLFIGLTILEAILCALIAPALTAGSVSIEREQQTLDLLLLTRLSDTNILLGKLLSSLSFALMVLLCALPVAAISFLLGGVDPAQFGWSLALIAATVVLFGAIGLYCSVRYPKTSTAVAIAYCACLVWLALVPCFWGLFMAFHDMSSSTTERTVFVVIVSILSATLALIPTTLLSVVISVAIRREVLRWVNITLWALNTGAGIILLLRYPQPVYDFISGSPIVMIGNPIVGLAAILIGDDFFGSSGPMLAHLFVPLTVGLIALGAWVVIVLAVGEFKRQRRKKV